MRAGDFGDNIIDETIICGMFGFGLTILLIVEDSVVALRCTSMCRLELWFAV